MLRHIIKYRIYNFPSLSVFFLGIFLHSSLVVASATEPDAEFESMLLLSLEDLMNIEVITTSKFSEKITDSPANIYTFSASQLKQRGYRSVEDLLQALPGVHVQKYSTPATYNTVTFRGVMGNNKFLILQDGVRLNSPAGERTAVGNNYPLYYAKKVEVLMGPASVVYGADAFMGVINIITSGNDDEDSGEISLTTGTDEYGYGYANMHQNFENGSNLNMGAQAYRSQTFQFAEDFPDLYNIAGKSFEFDAVREQQFYINYTINDNWKLGLNHSVHSNPSYFTAKPGFSSFDTGATEKISQTTAYGKFTTEFDNGLRSETLITLMNYEVDNGSYFNDNFTGNQPAYKYANSDRISVNQDFEYRLNNGHLLSGGLVYDFFNTIPKGADLPSPYDTSKGPGSQNFFYPNTSLPIVFFDRDYHNKGVYIQDNWEIDDQFRLIVGLRFDSNSFYGNSTNPRASLIYKHNEKNLFKLLYSEAFLAPGPDQASNSFGSFTGAQNGAGEWISSPFGFRVPNPNIKPEDIQTLELNYEHWFSKETHLKVAPYYNRVDGLILRKDDLVADQAIPGADLQRTFKFDNVGKSETFGVDLSVNNQFHLAAWNFQNWGSVSYVDGHLIDAGLKKDLPMVSNYKITAGTTIAYRNIYLLTPELYWIDETSSNQADPLNSSKKTTVPGIFLMNLNAEARVSDNFTLRLSITNLFDKTYVNASFGNSFFTLNQAPQPGRLATISVNYNF
ncbi:MAG TPA: TonB-dependent receptor [Gammaproteobacteria bacterium]|nr:TonB-dependent receptor [Gammaproteobacteria bacterium]